MPEEKPEDITPEIEIEIKPEGDSTPSSASDDLPPPPADDDLPPVPDDDELPPVPIDDDLPPVLDGDPPPPPTDAGDDELDEGGGTDSGSTGDIKIEIGDGGTDTGGSEVDPGDWPPPPPPENVEELVNAGQDLMAQENYEGALKKFEEALVIDEIHFDAMDGRDKAKEKLIIQPPPPPPPNKLVLVSDSGQRLSMNVSTDLGKNNCKALGEEARYLDTKQMTLEKTGDGWQVVPSTNTSNETILNARAITEPEVLKTGDVLAVGRESKGVVKMKMTVQVD